MAKKKQTSSNVPNNQKTTAARTDMEDDESSWSSLSSEDPGKKKTIPLKRQTQPPYQPTLSPLCDLDPYMNLLAGALKNMDITTTNPSKLSTIRAQISQKTKKSNPFRPRRSGSCDDHLSSTTSTWNGCRPVNLAFQEDREERAVVRQDNLGKRDPSPLFGKKKKRNGGVKDGKVEVPKVWTRYFSKKEIM